MKALFLTTFFCAISLLDMMGQGTYTRICQDEDLIKKAREWVDNGQWRNGFTQASPDSSVNIVDFYEQYQKNKEDWDALFSWLATTDLDTISKGKHPIEGTSLIASVEDSSNSELSKRQSESHYHNIDFQYVVKGIERFAVLEHESSVANSEYKPDVIHYDYDKEKTHFFDSTPGKFIIFFPSDWHIAKINNDTQDQEIRVIVIKVPYVE